MARWLCDQAPHDVVILGKAFKPGLKPEDGHTVGSPSMLVGWYVEKTESRKVYYDKAPDDKPYIYLIHDNQLYPEVWNPGSVIVDVNRELSDNIPDCKVLWYGVS